MNERGITLLELLVALTIMGMILVLLTSTMHLSFRSIEKGEAAVDSLERMRASFRLISSQVQSAIKPAKRPEDNGKLLDMENTDELDDEENITGFNGDEEKLTFPTTISLWSRPKGIIYVSYTVMDGDNGLKELHASETNPLIDDVTKEIKLLDSFDEIRFEYLVIEGIAAEDKGEWVTKWDKKDLDFEDEILKRIAIHLKKGEKELTFVVPVRMAEDEDF